MLDVSLKLEYIFKVVVQNFLVNFHILLTFTQIRVNRGVVWDTTCTNPPYVSLHAVT